VGIEENKVLVKKWIEGMGRGDTSVIDELTTDNFVSHNLALGTHGNKESLKRMNIEGHKSFSDASNTIDMIAAEGDIVATIETTRAKHTGDFGNIAPTGNEINWLKSGFVRIEDDKIAELWIFTDDLRLYQQLGALPPTEEIGK